MKKLILSLMFALTMVCASATPGWLRLNNGSVVAGEITVNDTHVTVVTTDGRTFTYPMTEVYKIDYDQPVLPEVKKVNYNDYTDRQTGFWFRATVNASYTIFQTKKCTPFAEVDVAGGYRFSQYLRAGVGVGLRGYFNNDDLRSTKSELSYPIFATVSGNFIDDEFRTVTPYWSMDMGGAIKDGFMWRPTIGIRVGQSRSAFLLGVTYTGQNLKYKTGKDRYVSAVGLTLGYEF